MSQKTQARRAFLPGSVRLAALVLAALTLCAALTVRQVRAAEWMTPYLEQVQEWGVMRGDSTGNLHEDRSITRAEFVTLVNRAFGYTEAGDNPFSDVNPNDWYAEDISIAHKAGYFNGTTPTTASPMNLVTREQAAVLLGRCLRLQGVPGAAGSSFTDVQDIGGWSRGLVQEAADLGIIQGYADGSFRPNLPITRGQMACFLVRALGTLIQEPGQQTSGGVYGNLTITTPGVSLKDTTVTGNLYLTGGVGLGNVELENVNVLGKIVVCGTGEAEKGEHSVVLRNVTAGALEVDSLTEQFLSVQAEGLTDIASTTVRTSAYLEDLTEDGLGLKTIRLDGVEGSQFQLAGNIKEVVNLTPNSALQIAQGVANMVTIDEKAENAALSIDVDASIEDLNLDRGTPVTGEGSISHLNINAPGSNVSMLPDTIYVRPGITGNVSDVNMDNKIAAESSDDPRLLAGYPKAKNIAPTAADAVFSANKAGTIHWAVTALMDGSLGEEELLNPGAYSKILRSGTVNAAASKTEYTARLTGLTREGSYYISALLEDARGRRSPVKVAAFTTPDDSVPNFASGYPQAPILTTDADNEQVAQIMVMPTKNCQMYYVLLPKGSTAPTAADFRSAALPGNLGYGVVTLRKNTPFLVSRINTSHLQEKTDYDLYLWLNDADNGKSSAVRKVTVTTKDMTPPTILDLSSGTLAARTIQMSFTLDEPGSLYWAVVRHGDGFYAPGIDKNNPSQAGKIQIENGVVYGGTLVRKGGPIRAARGDTRYNFTISGLEPQTAYDLYYVAKDTAGNYCEYTTALTPPMEIHTLDSEAPTVYQEFENDPTPEGQTSHTPYPNTDIRIVFSEPVIGYQGTGASRIFSDNFMDAYQNVINAAGADREVKEREFADMLKRHIVLYDARTKQPAADRTAENAESVGANWVLDYRKATVYTDTTRNEMIVNFPYSSNLDISAVNLTSGGSYYFVINDISDTSAANNIMAENSRDGHHLPTFTTIDVEVNLERTITLGATVDGVQKDFDMAFKLDSPTASTANPDIRWDMLIWYTAPDPAAASVEFELYYTDDGISWTQAGGPGRSATIQTFEGESRTGISVGKYFHDYNFDTLRSLSHREYGVKIIKIGSYESEADWSFPITFDIRIVAADQGALRELATPDLTPRLWELNQSGDMAVSEIGRPNPFTVTHTFTDTSAPKFIRQYPRFVPQDESVDITIMLNRSSTTCYYVIAPLNAIPTTYKNTNINNATSWAILEEDGTEFDGTGDLGLVINPKSDDIMNPQFQNEQIKTGSIRFSSGATPIPTISGLLAGKEYIAYFVLRGEGLNTYSGVYAFRFKTDPVSRPILQIDLAPPSGTISEYNRREASGGWLLLPDTDVPQQLQQKLVDGSTDITNIGTSEEDERYKLLWNPAWKDYTVLQAMSTNVRSGNTVVGTVFDLFVLKDIQDRVGDSIVQGSYGVGQNGSLSLNSRNNMSFTQPYTQWMSPGVNYYLLAAAKNPQGSAYGAVASYRLYRKDQEHPKISSVITSTSQFYESPIEAMTALYGGTLSIAFNEALYWKDSESDNNIWKLAYALAPDTTPLPSGEGSNVRGYKSVMELGTPGGLGLDQSKFDSPSTNGYPPCDTLYYTFSNVSMNTPITLRTGNLSDVSSNAGFGDGNITIKLELVTTTVKEQTLYSAQFVITNPVNWVTVNGPSYSYPRS